jgi:hypothetical protein
VDPLIVQTSWKRDDLQCVIVCESSDHFSVQVFIRETAVITEPCSSLDEAADTADQAAKLFGIFGYADEAQPQPR